MAKKRIGQHRSFLNLPYKVSLTSCISYKIVLGTYNLELTKENLFDNVSIDFAISDCSRNINLEFLIDSKEDMKNSLHKLDVIIEACTKMKEDIKIARKELLLGQKRAKELDPEKIKNKYYE